ncbi:hypothetical protein FOL47_006845 [Perkinsus chesapeaki]|uniref:Cilia- and flagella-associated protein 36 n=1 Tax=Perkinsus chesapeaki TaxID=330153 RepID=A0A7J6LPN3_PERCH|nr:hypothetical protein FOL47_006845 [Perkinsus chesapeaki]
MSTKVLTDAPQTANVHTDEAQEENETQRVLDFFTALELHCTSGTFTDAVSKFIFDHAETFDDRELDQDVPLEWHGIFLRYQELIENQIQAVLDEHHITDDEFATYIEVITEKGINTSGLFAIDYITAALDFEDFCTMMFQHKEMVAFEFPTDDGTADESKEESNN